MAGMNNTHCQDESGLNSELAFIRKQWIYIIGVKLWLHNNIKDHISWVIT